MRRFAFNLKPHLKQLPLDTSTFMTQKYWSSNKSPSLPLAFFKLRPLDDGYRHHPFSKIEYAEYTLSRTKEMISAPDKLDNHTKSYRNYLDGIAHYTLGNNASAMHSFERAIEFNHQNNRSFSTKLFIWSGIVAQEIGITSKAADYFTAALSISPEYHYFLNEALEECEQDSVTWSPHPEGKQDPEAIALLGDDEIGDYISGYEH